MKDEIDFFLQHENERGHDDDDRQHVDDDGNNEDLKRDVNVSAYD
jgi:hypothetical protein